MEVRNVPKLRFPEYDDQWILKKLKQVCSFFSGGTPSSSNREYYNGNIPFIGSGNIHDTKVDSFITDDALQSSSTKLVDQGDILYALYGANSGDVSISKISGAINQAILCIRSEVVDTRFIYSILFQNKDRIVARYLQGGQGNLSAKIIKNLSYQFPTLSEQQKIASFLSAVDKKIEQLTRKKELLEQYKKGVMQKLFPPAGGQARPGEQHPELRFKDKHGNDFPDWEVKRLGELLDFVSTNSLSRNDLTYESGEIKNIHYGDIHTEFKMGFKVSEESVPYVANEKKLGTVKPQQFLQPGDLVIADASEDYADIGKAVEVIDNNDEKIVAGLHTIHARDKKPFTEVGFKCYLFTSSLIRRRIMKISQGASVLGLSKTNLVKVEVLLPSKKEQRLILKLLQNNDSKISIIGVSIEKAQSFKKGLLQQMFV